MTNQDLTALTAEVAELKKLVSQQQARLEALTATAPMVEGDSAEPTSDRSTRRGLLGRGLLASLGAFLLVKPASAKVRQLTTSAIGLLRGFTGTGNTAYGFRAGASLDPAGAPLQTPPESYFNTAIGTDALMSATDAIVPGGSGFTAQRNSAVGRGALSDMIDGFYNDAVGADAGRHCNHGNRNTFIGNNAGKWVGSVDPVADQLPGWVGPGVLNFDPQGCRNVMIGRNSGHRGVRAHACVAIGYNAGAHWAFNEDVVAIGRSVMSQNPTASRTIVLGTGAMYLSTIRGDDSVVIGFEALRAAAGNNNVAIGAWAGRENRGGQNVFIGEQTAQVNTTGSDNVMIGRHAGRNSTGSRNIFLGRMAGRDLSSRSNTLVIHNTASSSPFIEGSMGDNSDWWLKVRGDVIPNADAAWSLGRSNWKWKEVWAQDGTINTSDARLKEEVADEDLGLRFIESLRPVVWKWKGTKDGENHRGLIAQEVREAADRCGSPRQFSAVVDQGGDLGLREREFLGPLIKAIQELGSRLDKLERRPAEASDSPGRR